VTPPAPRAIEIARAHHLAGRLPEAERICRQLLQADPEDADALNLLGVMAHQAGNNERAVELIEKAICRQPASAKFLNNLGETHRALGRLEDALACYGKALAIEPSHFGALVNRGNALQQLGRHEEAIACYDRALAIQPGDAAAWNNRGAALKELRRYGEAAASFLRVVSLRPDYVEAHRNLGNALWDQDRLEEALACYDRALAIEPGHAGALMNRGNALQRLKRYDEAVASYRQVLSANPEFAVAHCNLGIALRDQGRLEQAIASYQRALSLDSQSAQAHFGLGNALKDQGKLEEALASYGRALALKADFVDALNNRSAALLALNRCQEALASYEKVLAIEPGYAVAHANLGACRLLVGDFEGGWPEYEWRWRSEHYLSAPREFLQPLWLGKEDIAGKTILLHAEQGFGDTIQFARYVEAVARRGATVILEVQPALLSLLSGIAGASRLVGRGEPLPHFDVHCPLLSLPLAFGTRLQTIPAAVPYLGPAAANVRRWRDKLGASGVPRVGIAWSGNPDNPNDRNRSMALRKLMALQIPEARLISVQKEVRPADAKVLAANPHIGDFGTRLGDFSDTAALLSLMDVVVSVDTSVVHLAGALGKPVWVLLPFAPDWRWLMDREDSPWYPTARLFRQPGVGDWDSVVNRVKRELQRLPR
jgi:tetratricopeptide (TPR) repeat protein